MPPPKRTRLILSVSALSAGFLLFVTYAVAGWTEEGVRIVVRWTAEIGLALFVSAFSAGPLRSLRRTGWTQQLLIQRRGLGLAFALFHTVHLLALGALAMAFPVPFVDGLNAITLVGGGIAYGFMFAMAATSNETSFHALGARRWKALHTVGAWYIWIVFAQLYLPLAASHLFYVPFGLLIFIVPALRIFRWKHRKTERKPSAI
jgi:methionine sulfoxide reductase heme-binding subunit